MRRTWIALLFVAGLTACSFDAGGLGSRAKDDGGTPQTADAPPGTPDAAVIPDPPDANTTPDAATDVGIVCGNMTCSTANVCCVSFGGGTQYECKDKCGGGQAQYACDGPEDCKQDESCCFTQFSSTCAKSCGIGQDTSCRTPSDCPSSAGGSQPMCCPTQYPNIELCRAFCG